MFKYPKSSLLILLLSANLLVPLHSDFIFGSIGSDYSLIEIFTKSFNPLSYSLREIFFTFGEHGLGIAQVVVFFFFALYTFHVFELGQNYPLSLVLTLLCVGTFQYAQDLHPAQTFYFLILTLILVSKTRLAASFEKIIWYCVFPLGFFVFILIDWRNLYWVVIGLTLLDREKRVDIARKMLATFLFIAFMYVVSSSFQSYLNDAFTGKIQEIYAFKVEDFTFGSLGQGMNFDFAFLGILAGIFVVFYYRTTYFFRDLLVLLGIFVASLTSYQFKVFLAVLFAIKILRLNNLKSKNEKVVRLQFAFEKIEKFVGKLSAEGLVFLFLSIIFVSIVSFIKQPLTEAMFPVLKIDKMIDAHECPKNCNENLTGYLKYRFANKRECSEKIKVPTNRNLSDKNCDLSILNYDKFPDRWR